MRVLCILLTFLMLATSVSAKTITSDSTWKTTKIHFERWEEPEFNDIAWGLSHSPSIGLCTLTPHPTIFTTPMWHPDPSEHGEAYFRKTFIIDKPILSATLKANFDDDGDIYINGVRVLSDRSGRVNPEPFEFDITKHIDQGENLIALYAVDSYGVCQWAQIEISINEESGIFLDVPLIKQTNPLWKNTEYDHGSQQELFCGTTIGDCGCALTSLTMMLNYYNVDLLANGKPTTPQNLNEVFNEDEECNETGCISRGFVYGNVRWNAINALSKEASDIYTSPKVQFIQGTDYSFANVKNIVQKGNPVIMRAKNISHWLLGYGITNNTVAIHDPFFNRTLLSNDAYQNTAHSVRQYKIVQSDFRLIEAYVQYPDHILITDMFGRQTGYDALLGRVISEIPHSSYVFESGMDNPASPGVKTGVHWLMISLPTPGVYTIHKATSGDSKPAIYMSNIDAKEEMHVMRENYLQFIYDGVKDNFYIPFSQTRNSCHPRGKNS